METLVVSLEWMEISQLDSSIYGKPQRRTLEVDININGNPRKIYSIDGKLRHLHCMDEYIRCHLWYR